MAKSIVIVEDDQDQRNNYIDAISKKGYSVRGFESRDEALRGFDLALPDLVILDIILGDEVDAGFELCRDLLGRAPSLPVIFLTERVAEIDKISGLRLGAWDYLPKPISLDYLSEKSARYSASMKLATKLSKAVQTPSWWVICRLTRKRCWSLGRINRSTCPALSFACSPNWSAYLAMRCLMTL